jgi:hypothetical protein
MLKTSGVQRPALINTAACNPSLRIDTPHVDLGCIAARENSGKSPEDGRSSNHDRTCRGLNVRHRPKLQSRLS